MNFEPIQIDEDKNKPIFANPDCQKIFKSYPAYYYKMGYNPPWIGYFAIRDGEIVGVGGFIGAPKEGKVEIAYGTFKKFERQGIATYSCRQLIAIAKKCEPEIIITAKTSPEQNASNTILKREGFKFNGIVQDEEIGDAWEWILKE